MKQVSIQELKKHLSSLLAEVARGARIVVTRHKQPVAQLTSIDLQHLHVGTRCGKGKLRPRLSGETRGRYLKVLAEDRRGVNR